MDRGTWKAIVHGVRKGWTLLSDWAHRAPKIPCFLLIKLHESEGVSRSLMSSSLWPRGPWPTRFLSSWNSPEKNIGVGCHFLLQMHQFSSVAQLCLTLWNPMNRSTPGLPVHHQLPEFTQTHVQQFADAIQPSHLLSSPSPPSPDPSQHQGLFQWVNSSHEVAKVLEFQLQRQSS